MLEAPVSKTIICQKCGKKIQFVKDTKGKWRPVAAGLTKYHPCDYAYETFIDIYGRMEHGYSYHDDAPPLKVGYKIHDGRNCYAREWENEEFKKILRGESDTERGYQSYEIGRTA